MEKAYDPNQIETGIYQSWEENGQFKPNESGKDPVSVVIPPPNVTGVLHMGHALNLTLQDMMVRKYRLHGRDVCWLPGCDHAGIATQNVVEKHLAKQGKARHDFSREDFVNKVWEWKDDYGGRITGQIRKLGASVDWSRERFTMDDGCHEAVLETFVSLYKKGLIYRGEYIINWCPRCQTALSDVEVDHEDADGSFWYMYYPFSSTKEGEKLDSSNALMIATTRPETMFGDTAIAVHPSDKRFKHLIGKTVRIPISNKDIPVVADPHVDPEFGTGAVKVTPAHDANDYAIGERHNLPRVKIMDEAGVMNDNAPSQYQGQDRFECRKNLVKDLESSGFLAKIEPHQLSKGQCYRCKTVIEPYLSKQWFVAMKKIAQKSIDVVKNKDIVFTPSRWEKLYFDWMEDIRDWCISRQIWWGHRIPVWYCDNCDDPIVEKQAPDACPSCGNKDLKQDEDVLDTWFSSALWPFETFGWPEKTEDLNKYYPTTVLITGYDIITFWVSRMVVMGLEMMGTIPFKDVYIHGLIRDIHGKKMSKSVGNAVDPLELVEKFGADALRWSLASSATLGGQDIRFSEDKIRSCRNFMNKIWNATRYILMVKDSHPVTEWLTDGSVITTFGKDKTGIAEQWILSEYAALLEAVEAAFEQKNFALYCDLLWDFIWNKFCDWYVEMSKIDKENSVQVLCYLLERLLVLIHPVAPFISESLWAVLKEAGVKLSTDNLIQGQWPSHVSQLNKGDIGTQMALIIDVIREVRHLKKQLNISPGKPISLSVLTSSQQDKETLTWGTDIMRSLANLETMTFIDSDAEQPAQSVPGVVQSVQLFMPLKGLIDIDAEIARLNKQKEKLELELKKVSGKLSNDTFMSKAPEHVVEKMKQSSVELNNEKALIDKQISNLV